MNVEKLFFEENATPYMSKEEMIFQTHFFYNYGFPNFIREDIMFFIRVIIFTVLLFLIGFCLRLFENGKT